MAASQQHDGRFQSAEAELEVVRAEHRSRQLEAARAAGLGKFRHGRAPRVFEAEEFGSFVEGFAGGVVQRFAEEFVASYAGHPHQLRVTSRNKQCDKREVRRALGKQGRQQVAFQVVDAHGRNAQREGEAFGERRAHEQGAREARAFGISDCIEPGQVATCQGKDFACQRHDSPDVVAGSEFGDDAAIFLVHRHLGMQRMRKQTRLAVVQRETGFVAGRFHTEDQHLVDL